MCVCVCVCVSYLVRHIDGIDSPRQVGGNGLLTEDVLPGGRAFLDLVRVELGRGADPHRLDVGVVDDLCVCVCMYVCVCVCEGKGGGEIELSADE